MRTERIHRELPHEASVFMPALTSNGSEHMTRTASMGAPDSHFTEQTETDSAAVEAGLYQLAGPAPVVRGISPWTSSRAKRIFDCACVILALPVLLPVLLVVGAAVGVTSPGPILFRQKCAGAGGRTFTIFKFRTVAHLSGCAHRLGATPHSRRFTLIGRFLRRWKIDELPQLLNVLLGQMSLVGPRPKLPQSTLYEMACRPGLTSPATLAFARKEALLAHIPPQQHDDYYRNAILPAKHWMDAVYFAQATFLSDFALVVKTVLRQWDSSAAEKSLADAGLDAVKSPRKPVRKESAARKESVAPAVHRLSHLDASAAEEA